MEIKKKQEGISVPSAISFWNEISRMALVGKFPYTPNYRLLSTCASSFSFLFFSFSLLRSRFYQLERLYTHIFLSSCVPDFFFDRLGLSTSWKVTRLFLLFLLLPLCPTTPMSKSFRQQKKRTTFVSLTFEKFFFPLLIWTWHTANVCYLE